MLGHHWEAAEGTIVDSQITRYVPVGQGYNEVPMHEFVVDVRLSSGDVFRAKIEQQNNGKIVPPNVGAVVGVKVDTKSREVVFDDTDPQLNTRAVQKAMMQRTQDRFDSELEQPPGTL